MKSEKGRKVFYLCVCVFAILMMIGLVWSIWYLEQDAEPVEFNLAQLHEDIYAYRQTMVSAIPAENYDMLTVCKEGGSIVTVNGQVQVVFNDEIKPYAVYVDSNAVNNDKLTIYVPSGSVEILVTQSVGRN